MGRTEKKADSLKPALNHELQPIKTDSVRACLEVRTGFEQIWNKFRTILAFTNQLLYGIGRLTPVRFVCTAGDTKKSYYGYYESLKNADKKDELCLRSVAGKTVSRKKHPIRVLSLFFQRAIIF